MKRWTLIAAVLLGLAAPVPAFGQAAAPAPRPVKASKSPETFFGSIGDKVITSLILFSEKGKFQYIVVNEDSGNELTVSQKTNPDGSLTLELKPKVGFARSVHLPVSDRTHVVYFGNSGCSVKRGRQAFTELFLADSVSLPDFKKAIQE